MITLSNQAQTKIIDFLKTRGSGIGIRLGVKSTGCSGLAYTLEYVDEIQIHDEVFDHAKFVIVIDPKSLPFLTGMHVDYNKQGLNESFEFSNPNATGQCGCGESFQV